MKRDRFHLVVVVWGPWHTGRFLRFCLPSLLAPENLPALADKARPQFTVLTTAAEQELIDSSSFICRVRQMMPVTVRVMPRGDA